MIVGVVSNPRLLLDSVTVQVRIIVTVQVRISVTGNKYAAHRKLSSLQPAKSARLGKFDCDS